MPDAVPQAPALQIAAAYPTTADAGISLKLDMLGSSSFLQQDITQP